MHALRLFILARLPFLAFLLPAVFAWADQPIAGGVLYGIAVALLMLTHLAIFDAKTLSTGKRLRLCLSRDTARADANTMALWATYLGLALAIVSIVLLFVHTRLALFIIIGAAIVLPLTGGIGRSAGTSIKRSRLLWAEMVHPAAFILVPALWLGLTYMPVEYTSSFGRIADTTVVMPADELVDPLVLESDGARALESATSPSLAALAGPQRAGLTPTALGVTLMSALLLCAYVLSCLIRDAGEDRTDGQVTTPTLLGRQLAIGFAMLALVGAQVVAVLHISGGGLGWGAGVIACVGGMSALWALAQEADDSAPALVLVTQLALGLFAYAA